MPMTAWRTKTQYYTFRWSRDTGVGIVTRLWVGRLSISGSILKSGKKLLLLRGSKNFCRPHQPWYSPILLSLGSWGQCGIVVNLTTHLSLMLRLGIHRGVQGHSVYSLLFVVSETGIQWSRMFVGLNLYTVSHGRNCRPNFPRKKVWRNLHSVQITNCWCVLLEFI